MVLGWDYAVSLQVILSPKFESYKFKLGNIFYLSDHPYGSLSPKFHTCFGTFFVSLLFRVGVGILFMQSPDINYYESYHHDINLIMRLIKRLFPKKKRRSLGFLLSRLQLIVLRSNCDVFGIVEPERSEAEAVNCASSFTQVDNFADIIASSGCLSFVLSVWSTQSDL